MYKYFIILIILLFLFTGCSRLKWLDEKLGEGFRQAEELRLEGILKEGDKFLEDFGKEKKLATSTLKQLIENLNNKQKEKIDTWLASSSLNRYGDPEGTDYAGGTPLLNETIGESVERYFYILDKHPEILNNL